MNHSPAPSPDWRLEGYVETRTFANGRIAGVMPMTFGNYRIQLFEEDPRMGCEQVWCYGGLGRARAALAAWDYPSQPEPEGWHRHPQTGRRRPDGDPTREYVHL